MFEVFAFSLIGSLIITSTLILYAKLETIEMLINSKKKNGKKEQSKDEKC